MPKLMGMKAIARYINRAENTVISMIERQGFPARKVGGTYEAMTETIDAWKTGQEVKPEYLKIIDSLAKRVELLEKTVDGNCQEGRRRKRLT